jgi:ribosomal 30S subunit maturation factor RimM
MSNPKQSLDERLNRANTAIVNAMEDPSVQEALTLFGYTPERMQEGRNLLEYAQSMHLKQKSEYGDQYAATETLNKAMKEADDSLAKWRRVAQVALEGNTNALVTLGLNARRKRTTAAWLAQADQFYTHALADTEVMNTLAVYGLTQEQLQAGQAQVNTVKEALLSQKKEIGEAQQATKIRDEAIEDLEDWLHPFIKIARIALEETPQYMEKLGILERS